jgi:2,3-bisphosphoglycerate-independent phosphoglycerate mutase
VHVEATDEASHEGNAEEKIKALEQIDRHIVTPLHAALKSYGEYRLLISPDHPTPLKTKTHSHGTVPFALTGTNIATDASLSFDELAAEQSKLEFPEGWKLMKYFLG